MKFICSVNIKLPKNRVVELWEDPNNLKEWQDGFESFDHVSGEPGTPGARSKMVYSNRGKKIVLIETIKVNNLPDEFEGVYKADAMTNTMRNTFTEIGPNETKWTAEINYYELNGFMIKLMSFLFPGLFKRQTQKWLDQFRDFAEQQGA